MNVFELKKICDDFSGDDKTWSLDWWLDFWLIFIQLEYQQYSPKTERCEMLWDEIQWKNFAHLVESVADFKEDQAKEHELMLSSENDAL